MRLVTTDLRQRMFYRLVAPRGTTWNGAPEIVRSAARPTNGLASDGSSDRNLTLTSDPRGRRPSDFKEASDLCSKIRGVEFPLVELKELSRR